MSDSPSAIPHPADTVAAYADGVAIRELTTADDYSDCVAMQDEIWGPGFAEVVPPAILMVSQKMGGVCAGAFGPSGRMLGFVYGLTGVRHGAIAHWSDMLAVRPEARGGRVGERLKQYQRARCLQVGARTMYWTFDPLVARNAHLNLMRLGARVAEYAVNLYGSNTGSPLHGALETDRWIAAWDLTMATPSVPLVRPTGTAVVCVAADGVLPETPGFPDAEVVRVAVPVDHTRLTHEQRVAWRMATRAAFQHYLARGYTVQAFQRATGDSSPFYELARS
jgi:predicted GNAT superfamily acetyltransferase